MALYFFHIFDGDNIREVTEAECTTLAIMRIRMMEAALSFAEQFADKLSAWSLEVRDDRGTIVSMLELADSPSQGTPTVLKLRRLF